MPDFEKRIQRLQAKETEAQLEKIEIDRQLELKSLSLGREVADYLLRNGIESKPYYVWEVIGQIHQPAHMEKSLLHADSYVPERYIDDEAYVNKGEAWHIYTQIMPEGDEFGRGGITKESRLMTFEKKSNWTKADGGLLTDSDLAAGWQSTRLEENIRILESDLFAKAVSHLVRTGEPYRSSDTI